MKRTFEDDLTTILLNKAVISKKEFDILQKAFANSELEEFDEFLLEEGLVTEVDLLPALAIYYKVPFFDVRGYFFERFLLRKFPKSFLMRHGIIPLEADNESMTVVAANPSDLNLLIEIARFVSYDIYFCVGIRRDICEAIDEFYDRSDTDLDEDIVFEEADEFDLDDSDFFEN